MWMSRACRGTEESSKSAHPQAGSLLSEYLFVYSMFYLYIASNALFIQQNKYLVLAYFIYLQDDRMVMQAV